MPVSAPQAFLYKFPWESWGTWKYLLYVPVAAKAWQVGISPGKAYAEDNVSLHLLVLATLRYLMFQLWGTASRLPYFSRKYQIQTKGIKFEQIDHEANWESMVFLGTYLLWMTSPIFLPTKGLPMWDGWGVLLVFLVHVGPIEWIYYWAHRALHHHFLFTRYHQHHHSSFVTQPITSSNHPFLEHIFYNLLFGLGASVTLLVGHCSVGLFYVYILFIDFMNSWGHCNFEFIPTWVFKAVPPLKFLIYSPTFHSLHHSKIHTNFCLFMPLYDYIYGTVDGTTDDLHSDVRKGHDSKPHCVYLTHATELLSTFHLQFGFQTFAAQPFANKWYMWIMWPAALPLMLLAWLFARPFVGAIHMVGKTLEIQTWIIPRFSFHYSMRSEAAGIDGWIQECIVQAQEAGAKVIALALLNKERVVDLDEISMCKKVLTIPIVTGETLAAAIVAKQVQHDQDKGQVFLTYAHSRVGRAIAMYLCEHGLTVLALLPSKDHAESLRVLISPQCRGNLVHAAGYDTGKGCKVWVVGEQLGKDVQRLAPKGTHFHQFCMFPMKSFRKDCSYGSIPGLRLPDSASNVNACEDVMPRYVVRASYAAAMVHALEEWRHHDFGEDISISGMDEAWEAALKHGFSLPNKS